MPGLGFPDARLAEMADGSHAVLGTRPGPDADAPTVLRYARCDIQPPLNQADWRTPPFELTAVDGRWYGRGAVDCKGNIAMHLTALRALGEEVPVNLKLVVEGYEETTGALEGAAQALVSHLHAIAPWRVHVKAEIEEPGSGFQARTGGPAYQAIAEAMHEAYGRPRVTVGEGGATLPCNVLAGTYPDAELILMGVEEPLTLIHAPNESADPAEIAAMALPEALFLQRYAAIGS